MMTKHKQILSMVAVVLAAAASANAGTPVIKQVVTGDIGLGPYLGVQGGINAYSAVGHQYGRNSTNMDLWNNANTGHNTDKTKSSVGAMAGLKLGYVFKTDALVRPALELDTYWVQSRMQFDRTESNKLNGATQNTWSSTEKLHANTYATMVNGLAKIDLGSFQPYAGLGIGLATTGWTGTAKSESLDNTTGIKSKSYNNLSDSNDSSSSTYFAFQAIAGADYYFKSNMSVFAEYKFLNVCGDSNYNNLRNNIVAAGVRFHF